MNKILKIAHRGYSERFPENTILAFEKAIEYGCDMIELDVHLTRDRIPVVIHDDFIDRTSNGTGMVKEMSLAELREFNYNCRKDNFPFCPIPLLAEVIDLVRGKVMLNIEIKNCPNRYEGIEGIIANILDEKDFIFHSIVSSFDHIALRTIKNINPLIRTGMLYDAVWIKFIEEIKELELYSIHPSVDAVHPDQMKSAKESDLMIYPWVAKDRVTMSRLNSMGLIDGIMVNELELFNS